MQGKQCCGFSTRRRSHQFDDRCCLENSYHKVRCYRKESSQKVFRFLRFVFVFRPDEVRVYNCCTGIQKPISWGNFVNQCIYYLQKHPLNGLVWYPDGCCRSNWYSNKLTSLTLHTLPAYIVDIFTRIVGKKPMYVTT